MHHFEVMPPIILNLFSFHIITIIVIALNCSALVNSFMLFTNILVPYDGSSNAIHAFKIALDMAKNMTQK